jgi:hypothetical protein
MDIWKEGFSSIFIKGNVTTKSSFRRKAIVLAKSQNLNSVEKKNRI